MKFLQTHCNILALGLRDLGTGAAEHVTHSDGLPTAWRLLKFGEVSITQNGQTVKGMFRPEHADAIVAHAERKGTPIPVDSRHALFRLSASLGRDEEEVSRSLGSDLAVAYGRLERRADGLWLSDVEWTEVGAEAIRRGHFRYFSPVIRGLADGRLRITSVALTNSPALDQLDAIAASAEEDHPRAPGTDPEHNPTRAATRRPAKRGAAMDKLLKLLGAITGTDQVALSDEGEAPEDLLTALRSVAEELPALRTALGTVRSALALDADATTAQIEGALMAIAQKAQSADGLSERVAALESERDQAKKQALIDQAIDAGKLTKAMLPWAQKADIAALMSFLDVAPVVVPQGTRVTDSDLPPQDTVALTAEDRKVSRLLGLSEEDMLAQKKADRAG